MKLTRLVLASLVILSFTLVHADDVSNDGISASIDSFNGGKVATLHYQPESNNVSSISFYLDYPKNFGNVDTANCLTDLPEGFFGACRAVEGQVRVIIYSPTNEILPATIIGNVVFDKARSRENFGSEARSMKNAAESISLQEGSFQILNVDKGDVN